MSVLVPTCNKEIVQSLNYLFKVFKFSCLLTVAFLRAPSHAHTISPSSLVPAPGAMEGLDPGQWKGSMGAACCAWGTPLQGCRQGSGWHLHPCTLAQPQPHSLQPAFAPGDGSLLDGGCRTHHSDGAEGHEQRNGAGEGGRCPTVPSPRSPGWKCSALVRSRKSVQGILERRSCKTSQRQQVAPSCVPVSASCVSPQLITDKGPGSISKATEVPQPHLLWKQLVGLIMFILSLRAISFSSY